MNEVLLLTLAEIDLQEGFAYHEDTGEGRGAKWMSHVNQALGQLRLFAFSGSRSYQPYRRLNVPKTYYGIFYTVTGRRVFVARILDLRQDPEQIRRSLP